VTGVQSVLFRSVVLGVDAADRFVDRPDRRHVRGEPALHLPSVRTVYKPISSVYTKDDPQTWAEIKANGDAAIIGVGH